MATFTSPRAAPTFPIYDSIGKGSLAVSWGSVTFASAPSANDIVQFCKVPAGATVVGGWLMGPDFDTNANETFDFDIGWAANGVDNASSDGFGNLGVLTGDTVAEFRPVVGLLVPFQGVLLTSGPKLFAADTIIQGTVIAAAATGGTGTLSAVVHWVL